MSLCASATRAASVSILANHPPKQACKTAPKPRCCLFARSGSKRSGLRKRFGFGFLRPQAEPLCVLGNVTTPDFDVINGFSPHELNGRVERQKFFDESWRKPRIIPQTREQLWLTQKSEHAV